VLADVSTRQHRLDSSSRGSDWSPTARTTAGGTHASTLAILQSEELIPLRAGENCGEFHRSFCMDCRDIAGNDSSSCGETVEFGIGLAGLDGVGESGVSAFELPSRGGGGRGFGIENGLGLRHLAVRKHKISCEIFEPITASIA